jgi:hypothetical protein
MSVCLVVSSADIAGELFDALLSCTAPRVGEIHAERNAARMKNTRGMIILYRIWIAPILNW